MAGEELTSGDFSFVTGATVLPGQLSISQFVSNETLGENIGAAIGGVAFGFFLGPEAAPVGIGIGNFLGGVAGQLLDGKSFSDAGFGQPVGRISVSVIRRYAATIGHRSEQRGHRAVVSVQG